MKTNTTEALIAKLQAVELQAMQDSVDWSSLDFETRMKLRQIVATSMVSFRQIAQPVKSVELFKTTTHRFQSNPHGGMFPKPRLPRGCK